MLSTNAPRRPARTACFLALAALALSCSESGPEVMEPTDSEVSSSREDAGPPRRTPEQDAARPRPERVLDSGGEEAGEPGDPPPVLDSGVEPQRPDARPSEDASPGTDAAQAAPDAARGDAGAQPDRGGRPRRCSLPTSCKSVSTLVFQLEACCLGTNECGYDLVYPPELREAFFGPHNEVDATAGPDGSFCSPAANIFKKVMPEPEQRVAATSGADILITPACESRALAAFILPGCCMPSGTCGVSTHLTAEILAGLVIGLRPPPFTSIQCTSVAEINTQFRATNLAGFGQLPEESGSCDYADLSARLPPLGQ